jgi:hypothetical protein
MTRRLGIAATAMLAAASVAPAAALAHDSGHRDALRPGNLLVSGSVYREADIQPGVTELPPGCTAGNCGTATSDGAYPYVFNNDTVDGSFGVTSPLFLDQLTPDGKLVSRIKVPTDELVTSFSSKSEGALNQSITGRSVTFMDYVAQPRQLDVSNSNTPGVIDLTNPVPGAYYRAVAQLDANGHMSFTETNAYSGNNGRAAILNDEPGADVYYTAGNAGNGSNPQPAGVVEGAGAQIFSPSLQPEADQSPGAPTPVGSFSITQLTGVTKADKVGKDDNFRGLTVYNNVIYYTKGSGSNGVNTVYFVDTTGKACPNGVGLPQQGAKLPTSSIPYDSATVAGTGLTSNMCILKGFNTTLAKSASNTSYPFGIWFANPTTLYVADEGDGVNTYSNGVYTDAAAQKTAGLQKWVFDSSTQSWTLAYTLQTGLNLGQPYTVAGYPVGNNPATNLPWAPATDGLRNITGRVNRDGTATVWGVTSTVSGSGDQGADPNQVVAVTDNLSATSPGTGESFHTVVAPRYAQVVRGVSFTPGTGTPGGWVRRSARHRVGPAGHAVR